MQLQQRSVVIAATWIMASGLLGLMGNVTSIGGAAVVLGLGIVPPIVMLRRSSTPLPEPVRRTQP